MQSVAVVAWVKSEPHKAVPLEVLRSMLMSINLGVFWEVQTGLLALFLFLSFARSETPCPSSYSGVGALDPLKHLLVKDVQVRAASATTRHVAMRLKAIKQDPRIERPEAAGGADGGEDWVVLGDVEDQLLSVFVWLQRVFAFHGSARLPDGPFFVARDHRRPLLYWDALSDFRELLARVVSAEEALTFGFHGLRVEGYNRGRAVDPDLAVAHGGWKSTAHERYERFGLAAAVALAARMVAPAEAGAQLGLVPVALGAAVAPVAPAAPPVVPRPLPIGVPSRLGVARRGVPPAQPAPQHRAAPPLPAWPAADLRPLTRANAVGRQVLVPAAVWPGFDCTECDGRGWRASIVRVSPGGAWVHFVAARTPHGRPYADAELELSALKPL